MPQSSVWLKTPHISSLTVLSTSGQFHLSKVKVLAGLWSFYRRNLESFSELKSMRKATQADRGASEHSGKRFYHWRCGGGFHQC